MADDEYVTLEALEVMAVTDKAVLFDFDGDERWVPKSCIEGGGDGYAKGDVDIDVVVRRWFCDKEGLS